MAGTVCSICLDELKDAVSIPCGHIHCEPCIVDYIQRADDSHTALCPTCRAPFSLVNPDLRVIPKKYHPYINPSLRRVYVPVDTNITALNGKITGLQKSVDALRADKARLMDRAEAHIAKSERLAIRERDARMECELHKQNHNHVSKQFAALEAKYAQLKTKYKALKHASSQIPSSAPTGSSTTSAHRPTKRTSEQAFPVLSSPSNPSQEDVRIIRPVPKRPRLTPQVLVPSRRERRHEADEQASRQLTTRGPSFSMFHESVSARPPQLDRRAPSRDSNRESARSVMSDVDDDEDGGDGDDDDEATQDGSDVEEFFLSASHSRAHPSPPRVFPQAGPSRTHRAPVAGPSRPTFPVNWRNRSRADWISDGDKNPFASSQHGGRGNLGHSRTSGGSSDAPDGGRRNSGKSRAADPEASMDVRKRTTYVWRGQRVMTDDED